MLNFFQFYIIHSAFQLPPSFWRRVHNIVAHPLLEVLPEKAGNTLHDITAELARFKDEK